MKRLAVTTVVLALSLPLYAAEPADSLGCESGVKRSVAGAGVSLVVNAAATEVLKAAVSEMRPDRSDNSSFPSRHTSYAFTVASVAAHELARFSPFWVPAAHTVANAVAMQRVFAGCHYPSDALAGAALGIISGEVGYAVADLIFDSVKARHHASANLPSLSAETVALIPLAGHSSPGLTTGCGIESVITFSLPAGDISGFGLSARLRDVPVYDNGVYAAMLKSAAVTAEGYLRTSLPDPCWELEGRISAGLMRNFSRPCGAAPSWSGLGAVSAAVSRQLGRRLSVGCRAGCDLTRRAGCDAALTVAIVTKAQF